jgi:ribosome-binding protein aMBF1 (putative translation factor)
MYTHQDWKTVILKGSSVNPDLNTARRNNTPIETRNKFNNKTNNANNSSNPSVNARKLEEETEDFHLKKVPTSVGNAIERARLANKLTRSDLAKALNFKEKYIEEVEKGTAIYNGQHLSKIKTRLGIK